MASNYFWRWQTCNYIGSEDRNVAVTTDGGVNWTVNEVVLPSPEDSTLATWDWIDVQYGDNIYVAIDRNSSRTAYSPDAVTWYAGTGPVPMIQHN